MKIYCKAIVNIAVAILILLAVVILLPRVILFFMPFVIGWGIALLAAPLVRFFESKIKIKRRIGSAFVIVVIIALIVLLIYALGAKIIEEVSSLIQSLPVLWQSVESDFRKIGENWDVLYRKFPVNLRKNIADMYAQIGTYVGDWFGQIGTPTIEAVGNFAKYLPTFIIGVIMSLLSSYFFVADRADVNEWCKKHLPASLQERYGLIRKSALQAVVGYIKAQLKIEIWMYFLLLIGLTILHVNYAFIFAVGIAFLDLLPFFGTGTILVPWAIVKVLGADYKMAFGLVAIWLIGQLARQLIQPKIVGDSIGVAPLPTLVLLYVGYRFGGVLGMILAVPIGLIFYSMYEAGFFDTTKNSVQILINGINRFREITPQDAEEIKRAQHQNDNSI